MKTKEQILKWLNAQPWAIEFYKTVFTLRPNAKLIYNCRFIASAFSWIDSPEGLAVWAERDKEFRKWYKSEDKPTSWKEYCMTLSHTSFDAGYKLAIEKAAKWFEEYLFDDNRIDDWLRDSKALTNGRDKFLKDMGV